MGSDELLHILDRSAKLAKPELEVVLVEQHAPLALAVADEAIVLTRGRVAFRGSAAEIAAQPDRLEAAYLGTIEREPERPSVEAVVGTHGGDRADGGVR